MQKLSSILPLLFVFYTQIANAGAINNNKKTDLYRDAQTAGTDHIVVTATRGKISNYAAPYSISVIQEEEMTQKQPRSLPEVLVEIPGVLVQKTANGHGSPFLRGFTGYRTLALIDGVRYNNSVYRDGPNEYFSLIDFNTLEGLELLNGPASILYGSDAVGGTLNLKTKSPGYSYVTEDQPFMRGSQSNRLATAENSHISRTELELGKGQIWGLRLGYSLKNFGNVEAADIGSLPKTGYQEYAYDTRLDISINENWNINFVHQQLSQDDVWRTHSTLFSKSFAGTTVGTDLRRLKDQRRSLSYIRLAGFKLNNYIQTANLTLSYQSWDEDGDRIKSDNTRIIDFFDSRMFGAELQFASYTAIGDIIYGIDYYQDNVDSGRTDFNSDGSIDRVRIQGPIGDDSNYSTLGTYVQGEFFLTDRLTVTAGSRFSYINADIGKFEAPDTGLTASFSDNWFSNVNSIRANYSLNEVDTWRLWAGISQSFRAPNIADLSRFGASRTNETEIAATDLEPEKFLTYEIALKTNHPKLNFTGTYYFTDITDFITSTPTGRIINGLTEVSKRNSSSGFVQGIELTSAYKFDNGLQLYGNITWLEGKLKVFNTNSTTVSVTEPLSRIMPVTSTIGIKWSKPNNDLWLDLVATHAATADKLSSGDISDTQRIPPGGTPAYTLINLRGGKKINKHLDLNLALTNLLDEAYRTHGSGSNAPGFSLIIGLNASF